MGNKKINITKLINDTCDEFHDEDGNQCYYEWQLRDLLEEFGKQLLKLASENAYAGYVNNGDNDITPIVFKNSILDTIKRIE